jgi:Zn-dependent protease with chaperone function
MNFFEYQHRARRRSALLVLLFTLAVLAIVAVTDLVVAGVVMFFTHNPYEPFPPFLGWLRAHPRVLLWASLATAGCIGAASLYRMASLGRGGGTVAQMLGGVRIDPGTHDPLRRQLVNVIEEAAIAAGLPVPELYVLETEPGINAFAAGFTPSDAAIAVTRGALESLTRDELQGVVAHEVSHILHGDTRLNMRLIGFTFGILVIALTGRMILRALGESRSSGNGKAIAAGYAFGLVLFVLGYLGVLAARLIKAGVSRHREHLADASAVQFTRNPHGLAGALKKIAASPLRAAIVAAQGEEVSHMLIAERTGLFDALFASHPPIVERITRLEPGFEPAELERIRLAPMRPSPPPVVTPEPPSLAETLGLAPHVLVALVGNPGRPALRAAAALDHNLAPTLKDAAHSLQDALYLVLALLLAGDAEIRRQQLARIDERLPEAPHGRIENLATQIARLDAAQRLPLLELAFPALRQRPALELRALVGLVDDLAHADGGARIFDYALSRLLRRQVAEALAPQARAARSGVKLHALQAEVQVLFSLIAQSGHASASEARTACETGQRRLFPQGSLPYAPPSPWVAPLDHALLKLDRLPPLVKQELVAALTLTVTHDRKVTLAEFELLRVMCALLHCPLPPLAA